MVKDGRVPTAEEVKEILPRFISEIDQVPPKYSAKNVNGKRGYDLARAGIDFELPPKRITIYDLEFLGQGSTENAYRVRIECGGGTYIRSLGRDIAYALNTNAVMSALCRTKSGVFELKNAVKIEDLTEENVNEYIIPTESILPYPTLVLTAKNKDKIFDGVGIATDEKDGLYKFYKEDDFYGIAEVKDGKAKIAKKLC
jgi:tRNA pseudouridine55 synthase